MKALSYFLAGWVAVIGLGGCWVPPEAHHAYLDGASIEIVDGLVRHDGRTKDRDQIVADLRSMRCADISNDRGERAFVTTPFLTLNLWLPFWEGTGETADGEAFTWMYDPFQGRLIAGGKVYDLTARKDAPIRSSGEPR